MPEDNSGFLMPKTLARLFQKACRVETHAIRAIQEEISCWYYYGKVYEERVEEIKNAQRGVNDQSARNQMYDNTMEHLSGGFTKDTLYEPRNQSISEKLELFGNFVNKIHNFHDQNIDKSIEDNWLDCDLFSRKDLSENDDFTIPSEQVVERDLMQQLSVPSTIYQEVKKLLPDISDINLCQQLSRARKLYKLFNTVDVKKIKQVIYSANAISSLNNTQIQNIIDYVLSKMITGDHQTPKNNQIHASEMQKQSLDDHIYLSKYTNLVEASTLTAPIPLTHISNNSSNDSSRNGSKNTLKANDNLYYETNEVKGSLRDQADDNSDYSHDNDSEKEMLNDSNSYNNDCLEQSKGLYMFMQGDK
ncbi:hypothetical protein C1645_817817 [Glomus cerebriforme]|uniref:Uncharacterized protein n=1 Tax=Glomus cerebriforme TaxID=658196 RepID=A0A397TI92_9GLOM|nr:hypothetical protein C1645_817817 [Glomus cerebriforme]